MKKVLVLGGGHSEIPIIRTLKTMGFFVTSVGSNKDGLGHKIADKSEFLDFSDMVLVFDYFKENNYDLIIPGCNDFAMLTATYISDKCGIFNFDSYQTTVELHLKDQFRKICSELSLSAPSAKSFVNFKDSVDYAISKINNGEKIIVKPIDLTGGKGINKIDTLDSIEFLIKNAFDRSRIKKIVIEDFIEGSNHGFSCFILDSKINWYFHDNEYYYLDEYSVSGTLYPGNSSLSTLKLLISDLEKLIYHKQLKDGLLHVQFIVKEGVPYILEIMRRPPGDLYLNFVEESSLKNYTEIILSFYLGLKIPEFNFYDNDKIVARHCIKGFQKGLVKRIKFSDKLKSQIIKGFDVWDNNVYLEDYLTQKLAIIFMQFADKNTAILYSEKLYKNVDVIYHK